MSSAAGQRQEAVGSAPGKLILAGEHAVVFGHDAVAVAIDRRTTVRLRRGAPGPLQLHSALCDDRLQSALAVALPEGGLSVQIDTELPVGRGMGSSGALAVALLRARAAWRGEPLDFAGLHAEGFAIERVFHGTPSGLDHAVSALGGALRYRRGPDGSVELAALPTPAWPLVVLDSGCAGDTGAMVAGVRARRPAIDRALDEIGALSAHLIEALCSGAAVEALGPALTDNHRLLREIGVSTDALDGLVAFALRHGAAGAKLAGAGGGGVVIALCAEPDRLLAAAAAAGLVAWAAPIAPPAAPIPAPPLA